MRTSAEVDPLKHRRQKESGLQSLTNGVRHNAWEEERLITGHLKVGELGDAGLTTLDGVEQLAVDGLEVVDRPLLASAWVDTTIVENGLELTNDTCALASRRTTRADALVDHSLSDGVRGYGVNAFAKTLEEGHRLVLLLGGEDLGNEALIHKLSVLRHCCMLLFLTLG